MACPLMATNSDLNAGPRLGKSYTGESVPRVTSTGTIKLCEVHIPLSQSAELAHSRRRDYSGRLPSHLDFSGTSHARQALSPFPLPRSWPQIPMSPRSPSCCDLGRPCRKPKNWRGNSTQLEFRIVVTSTAAGSALQMRFEGGTLIVSLWPKLTLICSWVVAAWEARRRISRTPAMPSGGIPMPAELCRAVARVGFKVHDVLHAEQNPLLLKFIGLSIELELGFVGLDTPFCIILRVLRPKSQFPC